MKSILKTLLVLIGLSVFSIAHSNIKSENNMKTPEMNLETATFGGGCFWCMEAVFQEVKGIASVTSGYSGGHVENPTYNAVVAGRTGHAEVVQLKFDPAIISYHEILEIFFHLHDPTTLNRQGNDVGTQYRSVIFYHDNIQEKTAREVFTEIDGSDLWENPLVTEITRLDEFYPAEDYHQNYFANNPNQPYCTYVISPKMQKLRKLFKDKLQTD